MPREGAASGSNGHLSSRNSHDGHQGEDDAGYDDYGDDDGDDDGGHQDEDEEGYDDDQ